MTNSVLDDRNERAQRVMRAAGTRHAAALDRLVRRGVLAPARPHPGSRNDRGWTSDDARDAALGRRLRATGLDWPVIAAVVSAWRWVGRPPGHAGVCGGVPRWWSDAESVMDDVKTGAVVAGAVTPEEPR